MGVFESFTHSEEIQQLLKEAQTEYEDATERLEIQKNHTTRKLEELGSTKVNAWSGDMRRFLDAFGAFANVQMVCKIDENYNFLGKNETPDQLIINMQNASYNANEILKLGAVSLGAGALMGIATIGGVGLFAHASTGTAIALLSGAAKKNATLAWLGGGAMAVGGAGIAAGKAVLGGVVLGAISVVGGLLSNASGEAKLAEAKRVHAEAMAASERMDVMITGMRGIESMSDNYKNFIIKLSGLFAPYLAELDSIARKYPRGADGKVDFNALSEMEQKTLHLSWLLAQLYYHILSVPLLNEQGEVNASCRQLLQKAEREYSDLSGQAVNLENEKKSIQGYLSSAREEFANAMNRFYKKIESTKRALEKFGVKRIELWDETFSPFMDGLSRFENISVHDLYPYSVTDIPIEFIFESSSSVLEYISRLKNNGIESLGTTGLVEVALFGGEDFLSELSQLGDDLDVMSRVHRHNMSLWFTGELAPAIANNVSFGEISFYYISVVKEMVDGISGRENLEQAKAIYREVKALSNKINVAILQFDKTLAKTKQIVSSVKKYNRIQERFLQEMGLIKERHGTGEEAVEYDLLSDAEKRVFEMSFVIAKMQYTILASCILAVTDGGDLDDATLVIDRAHSTYKTVVKDMFKVTDGDGLATADLVWKDKTKLAMIAGFVMSALCIGLMILQLVSGHWIGLVGIAGALIAFPKFFLIKNLSQSRLCMWRCIRIIAAIVVVMAVEIIGMVV